MSSQTPGTPVIRAGIFLLCIIWGSTWLVIKASLTDLPPLTSATMRFLLAGCVLILVAPAMARREGGAPPSLRLTLHYAVLILAICYGVIYVVETRLPSGLVSVLWSIYPAFLAILSHFLLPSERLVGRQWCGVALGFSGVAAMLWTDVAGAAPGDLALGAFLLISPAASALGNLVVKRDGAGMSSILLNRNGVLLGGVLLGISALCFESGAEVRWTTAAISSVVYLALVGSVLAFGLYFWLLRHAPAMELSVIAYGVPAISVTLGAVLGGEPVQLSTILGMALVLGGVFLVLQKLPVSGEGPGAG